MQTYAPFGLRPAYNSSGTVRPSPLAQIASAYNTNIYQGYPININSSGQLVVAGVTNDSFWNGAFSGVEYNDLATSMRNYLNRWVAGTVLPTNADLVAYYTADDVGTIYEIQCNASLGATETLARAAIGNQYDFEALTGNSVTGLCTSGLNVASAVGAGDQGQMRIVGLNPGPDNWWTDPFPIVLVQNAAHPWVARVNVPA